MDKNHVVAIIPARGGSVGIPKKNLMPLCGKPLLGWTIDHALNTAEINQVYVSTDDVEISDYAVSKGVQVVKRPTDISGGDANSESAIQHVLTNIKSILEISTARGTFKANELTAVGQVYDQLLAILQ